MAGNIRADFIKTDLKQNQPQRGVVKGAKWADVKESGRGTRGAFLQWIANQGGKKDKGKEKS